MSRIAVDPTPRSPVGYPITSDGHLDHFYVPIHGQVPPWTTRLVPAFFRPRGEAAVVPTVFGFSHGEDISIWDGACELIDKFSERGARSLALEVSPEMLHQRPSGKTSFSYLAQHALERGLTVIPISSDEEELERHAWVLVARYINDKGKLDIKVIENKLREVEAILEEQEKQTFEENPYAHPDQFRDIDHWRYQITIFQRMIRIVNDLKGDLRAYAEGWVKVVSKDFDARLVDIIRDQKPDLVIVGAAHAYGVRARVRDYRFIEGSLFHHRQDPIPDDLRDLSHLVDAYLRTTPWLGLERFVELMLTLIYKEMPDLYKRRAEITFIFVDRALEKEPDLFYLVYRLCEPISLMPKQYRFLELSREEAKQRIRASLKK